MEGETAATASAVGGRAFVGRQTELSSLEEALEAAKRGRAQIVEVEGEAGMGKTALIRDFVGRHPEVMVLEASGDEAEAVIDQGVIEQLCRSVPREHLGALPLLSSLPAPHTDPFAIGAELVQALGMLQEQTTVVLVVDDLHWADAPSARALLFALRRLRSDQILVILATRPEGSARLGEGWERLLSDSARSRRLVLGGLSDREVRSLAARVSNTQVSAAAAERLRAHTDGHPLYLRSLLDELPPGALAASSGPLPAPHSLSETVVARLAGLSGFAQDLVAAAAVVGERSSFPTVAAIARIPDATVALEEALASGLLDQVPGERIRDLIFPHPLIRAAVYDDLSPTKRRALHSAAAGLIPGVRGLAQRLAAAEGPDDALAGDLERTARSELASGGMSAAADHLLSASKMSTDAATKEVLLLGALNAVVLTGDESRARRLQPAVEACSDGPGRQYSLGGLAFLAGDMAAAQSHLRRSVELTPARSSSEAAMAASFLAIMAALQGDGSAAVGWAQRSLAAPAGDPAAHPYARVGLALGLALRGGTLDALAALGPIDSLRRMPAPFEAEVLATRGQIRVWGNDVLGAVDDFSTVVRWSRSGATVRRLAEVYGNLADAQYRVGAWDDAQVYGELAVSLAEDMEAVWELSDTHAVASYVYSGRGAWDLASEHVAQSRRAAERFPTLGAEYYSLLAQATMARARGEHQEVLGALAPLFAGSLREFVQDLGSVPGNVLLAEAFIGLGRLKEAEAAVAGLEHVAERRHAALTRVEAARLRGSLEDARGEPKAAERAFAEGTAALEGIDLPFAHALLDAANGRFLRRAGRRRLAIEALRAARQRLASLDARPYLVFCDAELADCGLRPPPGSPANPFGLTAKERAVAHLAAEGMSNREIAGELYVSAKAVEYHMSNIFTKLGVTSRRQLRPALAGASG